MATDELLNEIRDLISEREELGIRGLTDRLGPSDWADIVQRLDEDEVAVLLESIPDDEIPEILEELDPANAAAILRLRSREEAADLLEAIDPDDATDIVAELPSEDREQILEAMEPDEAAEIRQLSAYPPDTAGGRMTPAFVAISPDVRADDAIVLLRRVAEEAETIYYVYVIDAEERLLGVLSLHNLVLTRPQTPVSAVMVADPIRVQSGCRSGDRRQPAHRQEPPGAAGRRRAGSSPRHHHPGRCRRRPRGGDDRRLRAHRWFAAAGRAVPVRRGGIAGAAPHRLAAVLFVAGLLTSQVLDHYSEQLRGVPALIPYIPLIIGIGGNVGSQTVTTLVRAIGVGEVRLGRRGMGAGQGDDRRHLRRTDHGRCRLPARWVSGGLPDRPRCRRHDSLRGALVGHSRRGAAIGAGATWYRPRGRVRAIISTFVDATGLLIYMTIAGLL